MKELEIIIAAQQAGKEGTPEYMIGEQLKEMAATDERVCDLLKNDLLKGGMNLSAAAAALQKYADENHGKKNTFCISPKIAEKILRDFYKLPERKSADASVEKKSATVDVDFDDFF